MLARKTACALAFHAIMRGMADPASFTVEAFFTVTVKMRGLGLQRRRGAGLILAFRTVIARLAPLAFQSAS